MNVGNIYRHNYEFESNETVKQKPYDQNETEQKALERSMAYI